MSKKKILFLLVFLITALGVATLGQKIIERKSILIKEEAWETFQKYLASAKDQDLETLKTISYQLGETCRDESKIKECKDLMGNAYFFGSGMEKSSLTELVYDDKQIILFGKYMENISDSMISFQRPIIYFVREGESVKLLSFNPFQGSFLMRGDIATSTITEKLAKVTKDTDGDTIPDVIEECDEDVPVENCVKTDPSKRDTDGDGFWDSTQALFRN